MLRTGSLDHAKGQNDAKKHGKRQQLEQEQMEVPGLGCRGNNAATALDLDAIYR